MTTRMMNTNGAGGDMDITERRRFSPLLPSNPIKCPFPGDYGLMTVVYNLEAVMNLEEDYESLTVKEQEEGRALAREMDAARDLYKDQTRAYFQYKIAQENTHEEQIQEVLDILSDTETTAASKMERLRYLLAPSTGKEETDPIDGEVMPPSEEAFTEAAQQYQKTLDRITKALDDLNIKIACILIKRTVVVINWPFEGLGPDPRDPESYLGLFHPLVVKWIGSTALEEVRKELSNPLFGGR
jgi:uncharacterized protein YukE